MRVLLKGFNPWVVVFVCTAIFHAWRGSWADLVIFGVASLVLLSQVFGLTRFGFREQPKFSIWSIGAVVMLSAVTLYFAPRHGTAAMIALLAFIPVGIALVMYRDKPVPAAGPVMRRTRAVWGWWGLLFALVELSAYVASSLVADFDRFPTVSVILDPVLETSIGRAGFVALWLLAGVYLFGVRAKR